MLKHKTCEKCKVICSTEIVFDLRACIQGYRVQNSLVILKLFYFYADKFVY